MKTGTTTRMRASARTGVRGGRHPKVGQLGARAVAYLIGLAFLSPLVWTLVSALKPENNIMSYPPQWVPQPITGQNFSHVLQRFAFMHWMWNSVVVAVLATIGVLILDSMAAYALARVPFRGRNVLFALIVSMLLVPTQVDIIPLFLLFSNVHLTNTYSALILPILGNVTGIYLLRGFFAGIPRELEEAAMLDGAGPFRVWWQIVIPLSRPALSSVAIITFVSSWNSLLWPLIVTNSDSVRTLPVGIAQFMSASSGGSGSAPQYGITLAAALMAAAPTLIAFLLLERAFVQGISRVGIKG